MDHRPKFNAERSKIQVLSSKHDIYFNLMSDYRWGVRGGEAAQFGELLNARLRRAFSL
jgi:hypothetical protein